MAEQGAKSRHGELGRPDAAAAAVRKYELGDVPSRLLKNVASIS